MEKKSKVRDRKNGQADARFSLCGGLFIAFCFLLFGTISALSVLDVCSVFLWFFHMSFSRCFSRVRVNQSRLYVARGLDGERRSTSQQFHGSTGWLLARPTVYPPRPASRPFYSLRAGQRRWTQNSGISCLLCRLVVCSVSTRWPLG